MQELSLEETIGEIQYLIANSNGDTGRLAHILETIKNKKTLYRSDQNVLSNSNLFRFIGLQQRKPNFAILSSERNRYGEKGPS